MKGRLRSGNKYKPDTIVFYDLETTGFNPYYDNIIEIGAVKCVNNKIIKFNRLISIDKCLPKKISEITKISDFDLKGKPKIDIVLKEFLDFIIEDSNDIYLIAHNNDSFDRLFLVNAFSNCKISLNCNIKYIDSLRFCQKLLPDRFSYSLKSLCKNYDINQENAHRAYDDAYNLYLLYKKMCAVFSMKSDYSYKYILNNPDIIIDFIKI